MVKTISEDDWHAAKSNLTLGRGSKYQPEWDAVMEGQIIEVDTLSLLNSLRQKAVKEGVYIEQKKVGNIWYVRKVS